jgi:hypothetical protein
MRAAVVFIMASVSILDFAPKSAPAQPLQGIAVPPANDGIAPSPGSAGTDVLSAFSLHTVDVGATDVQNKPPQPNDLRVPGVDGKAYWVSPEAIVTSDMVVRAWLDPDRQTRAPGVGIQLNAEGTRRLTEYTATHIGGLVAIVLNGRVLEAPKILTPISGGGMQIVESPPMTDSVAKAIIEKLMADSSNARSHP